MASTGRFESLLARLRGAVPGSVLARETGWLVGAKLVQGACSVLATLVVARHLGPETFGVFSLAIATTALVSAAAKLGLEHIAGRELSARTGPGSSPARVLLRMRAVGAVLGMLCLLGASALASRESSRMALLLAVLSLVPLAQVGDLAEWRLVAASCSRRVAMAALVVSPLAAAARVALALAGFGVAAFAWALVVEWAMRSVFLIFAARPLANDGGPGGQRWLPEALTLLRESTPLLLGGIAVFIYMRIDQFMIAAMLGQAQVGLYSAIITVAEAPLVLPAILLRAALPVLTRQSATSPAEAERLFERLFRACFYFHAVLAVLLAIFAEPLVRLLYGDAYAAAAPAFRIVVLGAPFIALGVVSSAWLVINRRTDHSLRRTVLGMVVNIGLNLALIPRYGIAGAAGATLIAQAVATYAADAWYRETRVLFKLKSRALWPLPSERA